MGNGRKMFLNYGSIWENRCPQTFSHPLHGLFTWTATGFKSKCDILPDLGFVLGFNMNAFSVKIRAVSCYMCEMIASM